MSPRWARVWFAVTALCVIAGVALSVYTAVQTPGRFHSGVERGFNEAYSGHPIEVQANYR
jgi:hypothetical protein